MNALFFLLGILSPYYLSLATPLLGALVFGLFPTRTRTRHARVFFAIYCLGALTAVLSLRDYNARLLSPKAESILQNITGHIVSIPSVKDKNTRFEFEFRAEEKGLSQKVKLSWFHAPPLQVGDQWQLFVKLKRPHGLCNPGVFHKETRAFRQGIVGEGYVVSPQKNRFLDSHFTFSSLRQRLLVKLQSHLKDTQHKAILIALVLGSTDGIDKDQWQVLKQTGTAHLVAISGLHIGLIAGLCYKASGLLWRLWPTLGLKIPAPLISSYCSLLGAFIYAGLSGFALPAQRACIMLMAYHLNALFKISLTARARLNLSLWGVLLLEPRAVLSPGFWLSFGAVGCLIFALSGRLRPGPKWMAGLRVQAALSVGLLPLSLFIFQGQASSGPLANLLAVPVIGLVTVPLDLLGLSLMSFEKLSHCFFYLSNKSLDIIWIFLAYLSHLPFLSPQIPTFLGLLCITLGCVLCLLPRGLWHPAFALSCLLPMICPAQTLLQNGTFNVSVLEVGQGLCVLVETREHNLLYDTGPKMGSGDLVESHIRPFLKTRNISSLDTIVVSHSDADHSGGIASLVAYYPTRVITPEPERLSVASELCQRGQAWHWDGVDFEILHPQHPLKGNRNSRSCILRISQGRHSVLLPGDIAKTTEKQLIKFNAQKLKADILIAPHHGSKHSSSETFIAHVQASYVVFSTGYLNRFRFPDEQVNQRYLLTGAQTFNTPRQGMISFQVGEAITVTEGYRQQMTHPWFRIMD